MNTLSKLIPRIKRTTFKFLGWEIYWTLRFMSFRKAANVLIIYFEKYLTRPDISTAFPPKLTVDPTAHCQLHCPLCPTGQGNPARLRGSMTFDNFQKLLDEAGGYLLEIDLFNWGEPFLNNDIFKILAYAHQKKVKVRVSSNLNHFPEGYERELVQSKPHHLVVSLDGTTQATYEKYRVGGSIDLVRNAVSRIAEEKRRTRSPFPFITWQFIVMRHNEHEVEEAKNLVHTWGFDRLVFAKNRGDMGQELFETDRTKVEKHGEWLPQASPGKTFKAVTCRRPWQESVVNWNGSVSPCCLFYDEKYDFGNAFKDGFTAVWNNKKYRAARRLIKTGQSEDKNLVCWNCIWNGFPE